MSDVVFGRLTDLPLREAWTHEAHAFTPWLAENIDHLSEVIGVPLELTDTEVRVETFAADILARNPQDDSIVLIENQLEVTDHTHLGQIMTYLAGLEAQTVVWIAPSFREPHLSAIRWLNEHTADGFSFFAVKLRVVRIGDSPFAPIFEIVEKPNDWDRQLTRKARSASPQSTEIGERRFAFWSEYQKRAPEVVDRPVRVPSIWVPIEGLKEPAYLSFWIGQDDSGVFLRAGRGRTVEDIQSELTPHAGALEAALGATFEGDANGFLSKRAGLNHTDPANHAALIDWMEEQRQNYTRVLRELLEGEA